MSDREPSLPPEEIERIRRVLLAAVSRTCPPWLQAQKDDLVQSAFVRVFRIWKESEESRPPPSSYVWKAAYSELTDEIRRARLRRTETLDEEQVQATDGHPGSQPESQRYAGELRQVIVAGLETLTPERRKAVQLYLSGFTLRETAQLLNWNSKRVDNERYRGLAELKRFLLLKGLKP